MPKTVNMANMVIENMKEYSKEVALNRAIPYINDGLKPVTRALAYSLYLGSNKLKNDKYIKSQTACSDVIGKYHPHGMDSVYEAAINLANNRASIIESGSVLDLRTTEMNTAARYTEIRLSPLGKELFSTINMCKMVQSDLGYEMPETLKARFPYQLFSYNMNISAVTANTQLPLNPLEVIEALILMINNRIKGKETTTEELIDIIKGPDLYKRTTIFMSKESLKHLIDVGTGSCIELCDVEVDEKKYEIIIRELPYREKSPILTQKILRKSNNFHDNSDVSDFEKIAGIKDELGSVEDKSEEENIRIVIKVDEKYPIDFVLNELYNKTYIKRAHSIKYIFVNEDGTKLELYSVKDILNKAIDVNIEYFQNYYNTKIEELSKQFEVNKVLEKVTRPEHTEFVGKTIYDKDKVELMLNREGLGLTEYEINEILFKHPSILRRLSDRDVILKELNEYEEKIKELQEHLKLENILKDTKNYIEGEILPLVKDLKRYSQVVYSPLSVVTPKPRKIESSIETNIVLTKSGLIYKTDNVEEDSDNIKTYYTVTNSDFVVFVTDKAHIKINIDDIKTEPSPYNLYIAGLPERVGTRVLGVFIQTQEPSDATWYFISNTGAVKSVDEIMLFSKTKVTKGTNIDNVDFSIVGSYKVDRDLVNNKYILLVTRMGYVKLVPLNLFNPKNRESLYNRAMLMSDNDYVVYTDLIDKDFVSRRLNIGGGRVVELNESYVKSVMNKGVKVTSKNGIIEECILEG